MHELNFVNVFSIHLFYLFDIDKTSGAHVVIKGSVIKGSRLRKTADMLLGSRRSSEQALLDYYGHENRLISEAEAGDGFVEDPLYYYKALAPIHKERLILEIRYWRSAEVLYLCVRKIFIRGNNRFTPTVY
jgi:hypothetical protein